MRRPPSFPFRSRRARRCPFALALAAILIQAAIPLWHNAAMAAMEPDAGWPADIVICTLDGPKTPADLRSGQKAADVPAAAEPGGTCPVCFSVHAASIGAPAIDAALPVPAPVPQSGARRPETGAGAPDHKPLSLGTVRGPPASNADA